MKPCDVTHVLIDCNLFENQGLPVNTIKLNLIFSMWNKEKDIHHHLMPYTGTLSCQLECVELFVLR